MYQRFTNTQEMSAALADPSLTPVFVNSFTFKPALVFQEFDLAVVDVASGSDTRVLVKKVLEWSSSHGKGQLCDPLFNELRAVYSAIKDQLLGEPSSEKLRALCLQARSLI